MNESLKAVLQLLTIVGGFVSIAVWMVIAHPGPIDWTLRFAVPLTTLAMVYALVRAGRRRDLVPEFLWTKFGGCFERDGLCFMPVIVCNSTGAWLEVHFQNRYAGVCTCAVLIRPGVRSLLILVRPMPPTFIEFDCPGGAYGFARVPFPIPVKLQGRKMSFEVAARTSYPSGAGQMLRFRSGIRAQRHEHAAGRGKLSAALLAMMFIHPSRRQARWTIRLPENVPEVLPADSASETKILWTYDGPTGGFAVVVPGAENPTA